MTTSADPFETIVNEHYEALYRFALSLTRGVSDAKDLTQHTFHVWATKGSQLRDASKAKTWLFTTLYRAFLAGRRLQTRYPQCDLDDVADELTDPNPLPADVSDLPRLMAALARVDARFQAAVALCYLENNSYKDIAAILDVPVGTVKSRVARGLTQLRENLLSEGLHLLDSKNAGAHDAALAVSMQFKKAQTHAETQRTRRAAENRVRQIAH
ncbi:MAG: RNA polymerase sigma factor [Verrucomicrobiota bacterium]